MSEESNVTPTCHHRFIKWLCTIQMKNKIRNTEMEYIARANHCVDSSFLGSGRLIGTLVFYCAYVVFYVFCFVCTSRITVLHVGIVQSPWWMLLSSLWEVLFFPNVQKKFMTSSGSVIYIYIYVYKNKLKWNITLMTLEMVVQANHRESITFEERGKKSHLLLETYKKGPSCILFVFISCFKVDSRADREAVCQIHSGQTDELMPCPL